MPIPEQRLYHPERLNRWFAVSSILMTASILWMIDVDYDRPWKEFQDDYFVGKAALAHLDYLDATREERRDEVEEARKRLADTREMARLTTSTKHAELVVNLDKADLAFRIASAPFSKAEQVLEVTKDTYERRLGEFGPEHAKTVAARRQFREEEEELERLRKESEHWEDTRKQVQVELRDLDKPIRDAEKTLNDLEKVAADALQNDQQYRGVLTDDGLLGGLPIVRSVINAPLFDFAAPKNTPGHHEIKQLVLSDVRQRLNYMETYTTDRCTTCHIAIDDPEFSMEKLAQKLERSLPGVDEAMLRLGRDALGFPNAPTHEASGTPFPTGEVTEHWDELTDAQQKDYFEALLAEVNTYLKASGRKTIELGQPLLAHPDLDLFVSVDSAHPMAKIGCTVCHEGNPQETDFVQAAHSPPTHEVQERWADKYYIHMLGVPNITFETVAHYWDRTMRLPQYTEAGCAKCHSQITDIDRFAGERRGARINLGQHLFLEVGCINCHNVDDLRGSRRVGPDLARVAFKLTPGFVQRWAYFPQKFRPSTRMPHFFEQENNNEGSDNQFDPHPVLRSQTEVAAISKYLFAVSTELAVSTEWYPVLPPEGVTGDVERGRELFRTAGCLACHSNLVEFGEEWITKDLIHRESLTAETALYRYKGMTAEQRTRYAMEHFSTNTDTFFSPEKTRFDAERDYNPPSFSRFAPELSGIGSKVTSDWLYSWLIEPTHYAPDTKMPSMRLTPEEAADIAAYLMTLKNEEFGQTEFTMDAEAWKMADDQIFALLASQRSERRSRAIMKDEGQELTNMMVAQLEKTLKGRQAAYDLISGMSLEDKKLTFLGSKMIGHYGCYACHNIPGFEETTPPGTDLSGWAEKPISQLDFAFYDRAFHHMREEKEHIYGQVYQEGAEELNYWSPTDDRTREQITHTHGSFAKHKMLNPRIWDRGKIKKPYDKLKMPNYYFSQEEAEALTTYLLSRLPPRVSDNLRVNYKEDVLGPIAKGRSLTRELNCIGCHEIEDNAPMVQQYFRRTLDGEEVFDVTNAPPLLWGEGAKVQHNWLHRFLQNVETLRPWLQVRMPSFNLTGEQATTLVEYFAALSQYDSATLKQLLDPVNAHLVERPELSADWYQKESLKDNAASLRRWAVDRKLMRPGDIDPLSLSPERLRSAHATLLDRVGFLQKLYDVNYPFVEPAGPLGSQERFALGERFINDMGCLKCHVLGPMLPGPAATTAEFVQVYRLDGVTGEGDSARAILNGKPYAVGSIIDGHTLVSAENVFYASGDVDTKAVVEGPDGKGGIERVLLFAASAPNLGLTNQRLRRSWVFDWMLEPQLIQPGTKMPQNFADGVSPYEGDPNYVGLNSLDQMNLLVDYMFDAGARNSRIPLPKIEAVAADDEFGEDEEFED